jgi:hypothetical protein
MRILFCYGVITIVAGVTAYLLGSVAWYLLANIHPMEIEGDEADEPAEDDDEGDREHDRFVDRRAGIW